MLSRFFTNLHLMGVLMMAELGAGGGASLRPENFVAGGGLLDDVEATLVSLRYQLYDYDGKFPNNPTLALAATLEYDSLDGSGDKVQHTEYYSGGDPKFFVPSEDGCRAIPVGTKTGLNNNTNAASLIMSLINGLGANHPIVKQLDDDVSVFDGIRGRWNRVAQQERKNLQQQPGQEKKDKTVLLLSKIVDGGKTAAPKTAAKPAAKPAAAKTQAAAPAAAPTGDLDETLTGIVLEQVASAGAPVAKSTLVQAAFAAFKGDSKNRAAAMARMGNDGFLNSIEGVVLADGAVSLAG